MGSSRLGRWWQKTNGDFWWTQRGSVWSRLTTVLQGSEWWQIWPCSRGHWQIGQESSKGTPGGTILSGVLSNSWRGRGIGQGRIGMGGGDGQGCSLTSGCSIMWRLTSRVYVTLRMRWIRCNAKFSGLLQKERTPDCIINHTWLQVSAIAGWFMNVVIATDIIWRIITHPWITQATSRKKRGGISDIVWQTLLFKWGS